MCIRDSAGDVVKPARIINDKNITNEWMIKNKHIPFNSVGYPSDRDDTAMWNSRGSLLKFVSPLTVETNIRIARGASGSPLFDRDNNVIGIIHSTSTDTSPITRRSFADLFTGSNHEFLKENISSLKDK